jgi:hypothetical protein
MKRSLFSYKEPKIQDAYNKKKQKKAPKSTGLDLADPGRPRRGGARRRRVELEAAGCPSRSRGHAVLHLLAWPVGEGGAGCWRRADAHSRYLEFFVFVFFAF